MSTHPTRRRWLRRTAFALVLIGAVVVIALLLPLPAGWAIGPAVRWLELVDPRVRVGAESATLRWRLGRDTALLEVSGLAATVQGRPLAAVSHAQIEIDKSAVRRGHYAPLFTAVTGARVVVDATPRGAFHFLASSPAPGTDAPVADHSLLRSPALPAPGAQSRFTISGLELHHLLPAFGWNLHSTIKGAVSRSLAGDVTLECTTAIGVSGLKPVRATMTAALNAKAGQIDFSLNVPEFLLAQMPTLPTVNEALPGAVAVSLNGTVDSATGKILAADGALSLRDGRLTLFPGKPAFAIDRVVVRGNVLRHDGVLAAKLEEGLAIVEDATFTLRRLEASIAPRTRFDWDAELTGFSGARLASRLPASLLEKA
ncbi:MAG: hypothetical protein ACREH8_01500, partial [Opitutaceae bacterium]